MRRWCVAILLSGGLLLGFLPRQPVLAQEVTLSQTGIAVEASAEDGVKARELALNQGRRAAWNRLLDQASIRGVPTLSDAQIDGLVQSIVVEQERPGPTRYNGQITVNFSPRSVQRVLGDRAPMLTGAGPDGQPLAPPVAIHAEAMASYGSLREWQDIRRRLRNSPGVAGIDLRGVAIGCSQILALFAGISRSGVTMGSGIASGLDHEDSAKFSFLLATPVILAAGLLKLPDLFGPLGAGIRGQCIAGAVAAGVAAFGAVAFLVRWFETRTLWPFGVYCLIVGGLCIIRFA